MADDPRRLMAGALLHDLEKQAAETPGLTVGPPDSSGMIYVEGLVDIYLLADAAMEEAAEDQARCAAQAEQARRGIPQTPEQISAFAHRWDAKVEAGWPTWEVVIDEGKGKGSLIAAVEYVQAETAQAAGQKALAKTPGTLYGTPRKITKAHSEHPEHEHEDEDCCK